MKSLNLSKRTDSNGRISIPKMLRDQYDIDDKDIELFTHTDKDGSVYLCLKVFDQGHPEVRSAIDVLRAYGCDVPSVLLDALLTEEDDDEEETADE